MSDQVPTFESAEEANKYVQSLHKGAELLNKQNQQQPPSEDAIKDIVAKQVDEAKKSFIDEKEARLTKVFLGDEDNLNAIKKTFKEPKDFEAWHKEAQEGKASNREIELLAERGNKLIEREAKEAEKVKEAEVAKAKEAATGETPKRSFIDVQREIFRIQNDKKSAFDNMGQYKDKITQQQRLVEDCNSIAAAIESADIDKMNPDERSQIALFNEMIMDIKTSAADTVNYEEYARKINGAGPRQLFGFGSQIDHRSGINPDGNTVRSDRAE